MKLLTFLLLALLLFACRETPPEVHPPVSTIIAYVHWETQPIPGMRVALLETQDTLFTDSMGVAKFSVPPGAYTLRAFQLNRGGPAFHDIDFSVVTHAGDADTVDIVDCLPCV